MTIEAIRQAVINDPENKEMTEKGWTPIFSATPNTKIVLIGQAPGIKTQLRRDVFRDQSGDRLRKWLNVSEETFYETGEIAVLPLDFYFPGKAKTGDLPPRPGFFEKWHPLLLKEMPEVELIVLIGSYAQKAYLKKEVKKTMTATVKAYQEYLPKYFPIPHPSPLNFRWLNKNPDFEAQIVPELQKIVRKILQG